MGFHLLELIQIARLTHRRSVYGENFGQIDPQNKFFENGFSFTRIGTNSRLTYRRSIYGENFGI